MNFYQYLKQLKLVFVVALLGPFLYSPIAVYIKESGHFGGHKEYIKNYNLFASAIVLLGISLFIFITWRSKKKLQKDYSVVEKFKLFKSSFYVSMFLLDVLLVSVLIPYFLTYSNYFFVLAIIVCLALYYKRPTVKNILDDLNLESSELNSLEDESFLVVKK